MFDRTYGVEIEAIMPYGTSRLDIAGAIVEAGLDCQAEMLNHSTKTWWKVTTDSSVTGLGTGIEIVSPILRGEDGFRQIEKVCAALKQKGCVVNKTCGLHVHVDLRHPQISLAAMQRLALLYIENQTLIDKLMPKSRRPGGSRYCRTLARVPLARIESATTINQIHEAIGTDKYHTINLKTYWRQGTVEFRQHSGTVEAAKIIKWTSACLRMVHTACDERLADTITVQRVEREARAVRSGSKTAIIHAMLSRPEGCTTNEVLAATGWRQVSVAGVGHNLGMNIRQVRERDENNRRVIRYFGSRTPLPHAASRARRRKCRTVDEFAEHIGMTEDERLFWQKRVELFSSPAEADVA